MLTRHPRCFSQRVGATFAEGLGSQTPQILFATQGLEVNFTLMLGGVGKGTLNWTNKRDPSDEFNIFSRSKEIILVIWCDVLTDTVPVMIAKVPLIHLNHTSKILFAEHKWSYNAQYRLAMFKQTISKCFIETETLDFHMTYDSSWSSTPDINTHLIRSSPQACIWDVHFPPIFWNLFCCSSTTQRDKNFIPWASNRNSTKTFGESNNPRAISFLSFSAQLVDEIPIKSLIHNKTLKATSLHDMNISTHQGRAGDAGDVDSAVGAVRGVGAVLDLKSFQILKRAWIEHKLLLVVWNEKGCYIYCMYIYIKLVYIGVYIHIIYKSICVSL